MSHMLSNTSAISPTANTSTSAQYKSHRGWVGLYNDTHPDIVEAHCYFVDIGRTDREQIRSRINNNDCRTFRPRRPLSTAYRTRRYTSCCIRMYVPCRLYTACVVLISYSSCKQALYVHMCMALTALGLWD